MGQANYTSTAIHRRRPTARRDPAPGRRLLSPIFRYTQSKLIHLRNSHLAFRRSFVRSGEAGPGRAIFILHMETPKPLKLGKLFWTIETFYPECALPELKDYCLKADDPEKSEQYHFGYGSLKWAIFSVNEFDPKAVKDVFRNIIFEYIARGFRFEIIEYSALTFAAMYPYKTLMRNRNTVDISEFQVIPIGPHKFLINETPFTTTNQAFIKTEADAILFINPEKRSAGINFKYNSPLNNFTGFKQYLLHELHKVEPGWKSVGDNTTLIINHGTLSKTPTILTMSQFISIIESYNFD
jgi:hypothetical protein